MQPRISHGLEEPSLRDSCKAVLDQVPRPLQSASCTVRDCIATMIIIAKQSRRKGRTSFTPQSVVTRHCVCECLKRCHREQLLHRRSLPYFPNAKAYVTGSLLVRAHLLAGTSSRINAFYLLIAGWASPSPSSSAFFFIARYYDGCAYVLCCTSRMVMGRRYRLQYCCHHEFYT